MKQDTDKIMAYTKGFTEEEVMIRHYLLGKEARVPDVEAELARCHDAIRRHTPHRSRLYVMVGAVTAVASALLLLFTLANKVGSTATEQKATMLFKAAANGRNDITLTSGNGETVVIDPAGQTEDLSRKGVPAKSGKGQLTYSFMDGQYVHQQITIPRGKSYKVVLADGTEVWLNADSKLTFPSLFKGGKREVALEGEAYFHVAKDTQRPFIVHTERMTTTVTGTEFNICSYATGSMHVTLVNGGVSVTAQGSGQTTHIKPGEDATIDEQGQIEVKPVDTDNFTLWKEGLFYFDNIPLRTVLREIGRWYNVSVRLEDYHDIDSPVRYIGNREGSLYEAIELLNSLGKVKVTYRNNTLYVR